MHRFRRLYWDTGFRLSLERGLHSDTDEEENNDFSDNMYRQPVLGEGLAEPQPYRRLNPMIKPSTTTRQNSMKKGVAFERRKVKPENTIEVIAEESDKIV